MQFLPFDPPISDSVPTDTGLTDYDRMHLRTYLRLLDAAASGATWQEVVRIVLRVDPLTEPDRAYSVHEMHLARARWVSRHGYRELLKLL